MNSTQDAICQAFEPVMSDDGSGGDIFVPSFLMLKSDADLVKEEVKKGRMVQVEMSWSLPVSTKRYGIINLKVYRLHNKLVSSILLTSRLMIESNMTFGLRRRKRNSLGIFKNNGNLWQKPLGRKHTLLHINMYLMASSRIA
jgi:hypothetical protein